jgi:peroxiredoxin
MHGGDLVKHPGQRPPQTLRSGSLPLPSGALCSCFCPAAIIRHSLSSALAATRFSTHVCRPLRAQGHGEARERSHAKALYNLALLLLPAAAMTVSKDCDPAAQESRAVRWLAMSLGGLAFAIVASLAALPFLATRPVAAPAVTLQTVQGDRTPLADLRGEVVLVSFWSTTCAPCMNEMPEKIALHRALAPRGLKTYAVAMQHDRPDRVLHTAQRLGMPFEIALDLQGEVAREFNNTDTTPTKFLIDRQGRIVKRFVGFTDFVALRNRIETELAAPRAAS